MNGALFDPVDSRILRDAPRITRLERKSKSRRGAVDVGVWQQDCIGSNLDKARARWTARGEEASVAVDVVTETVIHRPIEVVSAYAANPDNAREWYVNIKSVEWKTPP